MFVNTPSLPRKRNLTMPCVVQGAPLNSMTRRLKITWTTCVARTSTFFGAKIRSSFTRSEEHTSELQSLMRISYAVFCLKKKNQQRNATRLKKHSSESYTKNT